MLVLLNGVYVFVLLNGVCMCVCLSVLLFSPLDFRVHFVGVDCSGQGNAAISNLSCYTPLPFRGVVLPSNPGKR